MDMPVNVPVDDPNADTEWCGNLVAGKVYELASWIDLLAGMIFYVNME